MKRHVVITGIGVVTPLGIGKDVFWNNSLIGTPAIGPITRFDPARFQCKEAGEINNFQAEKHLNIKICKQTDRSTQMALVASALALEDSGLDRDQENLCDVGIYFASLFGGMEFAEPELYGSTFLGPRSVSAYQSIAWFYAATQGQLSIGAGIRGYAKSIVADLAGGLQAVGFGSRAIQAGHCKVVVAGGFEAPLAPYVYLIHETSGTLARPKNGLPCSYLPFDSESNGMILGEGAAVVVLEESEHAVARAARIYGEISGFAVTRSGRSRLGPTANSMSMGAACLAQCFATALSEAGADTSSPIYYCADAAARQEADREEVEAIREVFGQDAANVRMSAPKTLTGHTLAAAGAMDVIWTILMMKEHTFLPTANLEQSYCPQIDQIRGRPYVKEIGTALCCSRGIDGLNSSVVLTASKQDN
jgi:3-oxoacyl-(acyl-carrier-protein) synthase